MAFKTDFTVDEVAEFLAAYDAAGIIDLTTWDDITKHIEGSFIERWSAMSVVWTTTEKLCNTHQNN